MPRQVRRNVFLALLHATSFGLAFARRVVALRNPVRVRFRVRVNVRFRVRVNVRVRVRGSRLLGSARELSHAGDLAVAPTQPAHSLGAFPVHQLPGQG